MSFTLKSLQDLDEKELWFLCYLFNKNDRDEIVHDLKKILPLKYPPTIKCYIYKLTDLSSKIWKQNGKLINKMLEQFISKTGKTSAKDKLNEMIDIQENHLIESYSKCKGINRSKPSLNNLKNANKLCNLYEVRTKEGELEGCCKRSLARILKASARTITFVNILKEYAWTAKEAELMIKIQINKKILEAAENSDLLSAETIDKYNAMLAEPFIMTPRPHSSNMEGGGGPDDFGKLFDPDEDDDDDDQEFFDSEESFSDTKSENKIEELLKTTRIKNPDALLKQTQEIEQKIIQTLIANAKKRDESSESSDAESSITKDIKKIKIEEKKELEQFEKTTKELAHFEKFINNKSLAGETVSFLKNLYSKMILKMQIWVENHFVSTISINDKRWNDCRNKGLNRYTLWNCTRWLAFRAKDKIWLGIFYVLKHPKFLIACSQMLLMWKRKACKEMSLEMGKYTIIRKEKVANAFFTGVKVPWRTAKYHELSVSGKKVLTPEQLADYKDSKTAERDNYITEWKNVVCNILAGTGGTGVWNYMENFVGAIEIWFAKMPLIGQLSTFARILLIIVLKDSLAEFGQLMVYRNAFGTIGKILNPSNCIKQQYIEKVGGLRGTTLDFINLLKPKSLKKYAKIVICKGKDVNDILDEKQYPEVAAILEIKDNSQDPYLSGVGNLMDFFQDLSFKEGRAVEMGKAMRTDTQAIIFSSELKKMIRIMHGKHIYKTTPGCASRIDKTDITDEDVKTNNLRWRGPRSTPALRGVPAAHEAVKVEKEKQDAADRATPAGAWWPARGGGGGKFSGHGGSIKLKKRKKKQKKKKKKTRKSLHLK